MDLALLERLVKLMTANDLNTVEVRDGGKRVVLKRGREVTAASPGPGFMVPAHSVAPSHPAQSSATASATLVESEKDLLSIKSPMVGTFYAAPSPDAPPFVSVGSEVDEDTDVCIIEAMKVYNNIKAECRGSIERILVSNGQTVEFGQVLFLVKPK